MTTDKKINKPELLAPCGSLESFFAAMESGADAVYLGLREFSARARARNFTLGQLGKMLSFTHQQGRKIYITLNTLLKEQELPQLVETLAELARLRVDGVILQDMAVARLIRNYFPSIPLHASTQMTIHNLAGVQLLEELGFERVVLARELQLADIASIAAQCRPELEIFIHGALCFCISGQCHFSSFLGGHSGNRGRCAQPCRRLYSQRGKEGYYFSPNDLSAIELIPELTAAGVKSLKIEGRMKSADYVAKVVKAYRLVMDSDKDRLKPALTAAKQLLKESFGRAPTRGFLASADPVDIANPWLKGSTGRYIGEVKQLRGGRILFESRDPLQVGDRLRLQPKSDQAGQAWTIRELYQGGRQIHTAKGGTIVETPCPFGAGGGDSIFKVAAADSFGMSDEAANRRLLAVGPDRRNLDLKLCCNNASGGWQMDITAKCGAATFDYSFRLGPLEPSRSTDMTGVLTARFSETGDTPFQLASLDAVDFPPLFIPPARLKEIRRELYRLLERDLTAAENRSLDEGKTAALVMISAVADGGEKRQEHEELLLQLPSVGDIRWGLSQGADQVIVPLLRANIHQLPRYIQRLRGDVSRVVWQLPFMLFNNEPERVMQTVELLYQSGHRNFELTNPGQFRMLEKYRDLQLSGGYRLFTMNSQAMLQWMELGLKRATIYIESDRENMAALLKSALPLTVLAYSPVDMMVTRIRLKEVKSGVELLSDRGDRYRIKTIDGLEHISSCTPFSLTGRLDELRKSGCRSFCLDLSETAVAERDGVIQAFKANRIMQGSTEFNYERGLI